MKTLLAALLTFFIAATAAAQSITVAAASDLQTVLPEVAKRFEKETKIHVTSTFGSSGSVFAQIQNGAPFDLFLSADTEYPGRLEDAGLAVKGSLTEYAVGRVVLWTKKDSGVNVSMGFGILASPRVRRIAIANPEHAPYGRAAVAALDHERLYQELQKKLVLGENVAQAAQFVQSGNADAGIISLSLALSPPMKRAGTMYEIPSDWYRPLIQGAVIIERSRQKEAAKRFLDFLRQPEIERIFEQAGFAVKK